MTPTLAVLAATVLIAAFVQGSTGMGFALIAVPVFSLVRPGLVPVVVLLLMLPLNAYVTVREREAIDWFGAKWITLGRVLGTGVGLWILTVVSGRALDLFIGVSTVAAAVLALRAPTFAPGRNAFGVVGVVTGVTETSTGIGGPPLALAYQHASGPTLRSTVALCFLLGELVSLVALAVGGAVGGSLLLDAATLLPPLLVGAWLSRYVHHRLDGPLVRLVVLSFAVVSGIAVCLRAL